MPQRVNRFATKPGDLSSISRTHMEEGQNQLTPASCLLTSTHVSARVCLYTYKTNRCNRIKKLKISLLLNAFFFLKMDIKMHSGARMARGMAQLVKVLAAKTKDLSSITGPTWWKERTGSEAVL